MTEESSESIGALLARMVEDAKAYGRAELAYVRAEAAARFAAARAGLIAGAVAALLALAALIALVVGALMSLAPLIGPLGATLAVVAATLIAAALLGRFAVARIRRAFTTEGAERR